MQRDIRRWRMAGQFLTTPGPRSASEVVRALGAVQAQDYAGAKWGIAQRFPDATDAEIEAEIDAGQILRTHVLRPTWHFVTPSDIRWMLALTGPRVASSMEPGNRRLELDGALLRRSQSIITRALRGGRSLTRAELNAHLERAGIVTGTGQRLSYIMMRAELDAVVCSGPRRGRQATYALLEERVPPTPMLSRDEALLELTRRYFRTRGPATPHDFAWWSGLTVSDAKQGIAMTGQELERITIDETAYWRAGDAASPSRPKPSAHLLPNFDEYFIAYRDRSAIGKRLNDVSSVMVVSGLVPHVIVVNGELVGKWKRSFERGGVTVVLETDTSLTNAESKRVSQAARRFGEFLGLPLELRSAE